MCPVSWLEVSTIPRGCRAVLATLQFSPEPFDSASDRAPEEPLRSLRESDWRTALGFADNSRLTLLLGDRGRSQLPTSVRKRIEGNLETNRVRLRRLTDDYMRIADRLAAGGVEHTLLKGFLQAPRFVPDASLRQQYDLDLLLRPGDVHRAQVLIEELGYEPAFAPPRHPADHLPPLVRKTGWQWRGDFFDPEMPTTVELHFRLWDEQTERFAIEGLEQVWDRMETRHWEGRSIPSLHPADQLGYASLHLLRHLLRGDVTAFHVYEVAHFLETSITDDDLWTSWHALHSPSFRRLESVTFALAARWFGCRLPPPVKGEMEGWPAEFHCWFADYATKPIEALYRPNKDELWLHLALLEGWSDRLRVLRRRLLPTSGPRPTDTLYITRNDQTPALRFRKAVRYTGFVVSRVRFHLQTLVTTALGAWLWRRRRSRFAEKAQLG